MHCPSCSTKLEEDRVIEKGLPPGDQLTLFKKCQECGTKWQSYWDSYEQANQITTQEY